MTREEEIQKAWDEYRRPFHGSWHTPSNEFIAGFNAGEKYANEHPAKKQTVTIDAWVARNKHIDADSNTDLVLGKERPTLNYNTWCSMEEYFPLPQDAFPNITFENSPQKVKVTIELEDEQ